MKRPQRIAHTDARSARQRVNRDRKRKATLRASKTALLIIDCINDLEFSGGEKVLPWAERLTPRLKAFCARARRVQLPLIYVNDNFGNWRGDFAAIYRHCTRSGARGRGVSRSLKPLEHDYFILKPRHSAFFSTSLIPLLRDLRITHLILAGMATNLCVLFTAHDAHMHQYSTIALSDCCAAESDFDHDIALDQLKRFCATTVCLSTEVELLD